jgi:uncharacterized membrane protein YoaK (UPF0700 family)
MAIRYIRSLTGRRRTPLANQHLGFALAFVAGAINAGGFLAVQQYTSHMTGIVSSMADNAALGTYDLMLRGASALLSFIAGAACSAIMVNYSRRRRCTVRSPCLCCSRRFCSSASASWALGSQQ